MTDTPEDEGKTFAEAANMQDPEHPHVQVQGNMILWSDETSTTHPWLQQPEPPKVCAVVSDVPVDGELAGRINLYLGARGGEHVAIQGIITPYPVFLAKRDELLAIVGQVDGFRIGMFEFIAELGETNVIADGTETKVINRGFGYEVLYLRSDMLVGIGLERFHWSDGAYVPTPVSVWYADSQQQGLTDSRTK